MAYSKRPAYGKKRTYRKKTYKRKPKSSFASAAISAISGFALKKLKNRLGLNTESKYLDTTVASTAIDTTFTGISTALTIPQGNTTNTRSGNNCRMTCYNMRLSLKQNSAATVGCRVRLIGYVQPRMQTAGAIFNANDILEDHTASLDTPYDMNTNGYNIIYDKTFDLPAPTSEGANKTITFIYKPLAHEVEWNDADTTGSAANLLRGNLRFLIADDAAASHPTYSAYTRVKFVDN